ncbi:MAG: DUF3782 domain-containing protein [Candidatus Heimdallarchaeota archaeon]
MSSNKKGIPSSQLEVELRKILPEILKELSVVYSSKELLTREEFHQAITLFQQRFKAMDKRFEDLLQTMNARFEAVDKRFEAVDKRFEAVDKRFEDLLQTMNARFEAVDKRFEAVDKRFESMQQNFQTMVAELDKGFQTVRRDVATISTKYGLRLEDIFREVFKEALLTEGVDPEKLRRLNVLDDEGVVVPSGEVTDIDMMVHNTQCVFVEVKARMDLHDIQKFLKTVALAEKQENVKATKLLAITLDISPRDRIKAERLGIKVITSDDAET